MKRLARWAPLFLFLFSLAMRFLAIYLTKFDGLYGRDAFAYYQHALALRQAIITNQLPPPFFWPLGYPFIFAVGTWLPLPTAVVGQLLSVLAGAAIAPLVYLLVTATKPEAYGGGLVAGLLAATAAQLFLSSLSIMADALALFWATLSTWVLVRYVNRLQLRWLVITAVTLSLAALTRWVYALLAPLWGVALLQVWYKAGYSFRYMVGTAAVAILIGAGFFGLHSATSLTRAELSNVGDFQVLANWQLKNAFANSVTNPDGNFQYEYRIGHFYARPSFHPAYVFPLLAPFLLLGIWSIRHAPAWLIALLIGWPLLHYLLLIGLPWQNWRFPLSFFPPLLILVGLGVDWLWQRLIGRWQRWLVVSYCALALSGSGVWAVRDVGQFTTWVNHQRQTAVSLADQLSANTTLIAFGLTAAIQHYTAINTVDIYRLDKAEIADILDGATAVYLFLDPLNIQTQWFGKTPEQNFRWLQENTELKQIAQYDSFILYQVIP